MKIYSFENANTITAEDGSAIYDLFERTLRNVDGIKDSTYYIPLEYSGRIDMISNYLYNGTQYTEELMVMNNIVNPFSMKQDDIIYYASDPNNLNILHKGDDTTNKENKYKILNINSSKASGNISSLPPSVNPGLKQMDIDYNKKKITIINQFK